MKTILSLSTVLIVLISFVHANLGLGLSSQLSAVTTGISETASTLSKTTQQSLSIIESKVKGISKNTLNFFSITPQSYLRLIAPIYDFLPTISSKPATSSTSLSPVKHPSTISRPTISSPSLVTKPSLPLIQPPPITTESSHIVNIFCTQKIGKLRKTITGSGILINQNGTVLTNAHVAQFPFLSEKDNSVSCIARYGDPATGALSIKTVFISPSWVMQYGPYLSGENPLQTGKGDFAILAINMDELPKNPSKSSSNLTAMPLKPDGLSNSLLSGLPVNSSIALGQSIYSLSYPANILGEKGVNANLPIVKEDLIVSKMYSLGVTEMDVIETSPSFAGQKGSSGGAIIDSYGRFLGMITTTVNSSVSGKANIRAITVEHINKMLSESLVGATERDNQNTSIDLYDLANYPSSLINLKTHFDRNYRENLYRYIK